MTNHATGDFLPTANRDINIKWVELDHPRDTASPFSGQDGCATTSERIKDQPISSAAVADQVCDQTDRLDGRMKREVAASCRIETVDTGTINNVGPIAPLTPEAEVVDVRSDSILEDCNQFMF